ncbi:MAG: hypothetical protein FWE17_02690 [Alphaproteobacteria bacterium]|jgi:hypothetical protein|nr:hypothetical protein [Alphaproteobacteria bacterium]MCL2757926.1 hypothetical protein [Alphaproteobacteria bacterium]
MTNKIETYQFTLDNLFNPPTKKSPETPSPELTEATGPVTVTLQEKLTPSSEVLKKYEDANRTVHAISLSARTEALDSEDISLRKSLQDTIKMLEDTYKLPRFCPWAGKLKS